MIMLKKIPRIIAIPVLLFGAASVSHADYPCYENCPSNTVTYKVDTYEDNQNVCGYDVEAKPQVCAQTQVVQVDTTKITRAPGAGSMRLDAETTSDTQYTSRVSFGDSY